MSDPILIPHIVQGRVVEGDALEYKDSFGNVFRTPALDLDTLVLPRTQDGPSFNTPIAEVLDFLQETGERLRDRKNPYIGRAKQLAAAVSPHSTRVMDNCYDALPDMFDRRFLAFQVEREIGAALDGWVKVERPAGRRSAQVRAFPPRLIHISAGNGPGGAAFSIVRGALTKGVNLLKVPSNDLFTTQAILQTMALIDPEHPVLRSFSAVYWRGGDAAVEGKLFRPQYFDKLVAWGGESTVRNAIKYIGPGFELVSFDPKTSISMLGVEAFKNAATIADVAHRVALDTMLMNQEGCSSTRVVYAEGAVEDIDRFCERLAAELAVDRDRGDAVFMRTPTEIRETVEGLSFLDTVRVFGDYDGHGLVVRMEESLDFYPTAKTVVVIPVDSLMAATANANVATQTVSVFPTQRKAQLRDRLAAAGVQRVVSLGAAGGLTSGAGLPHDGFWPLQKMMRWVADEPTDDGD